MKEFIAMLKGKVVSYTNNLHFRPYNEFAQQSPIVIFQDSNKSFCYLDENNNKNSAFMHHEFLLMPLIYSNANILDNYALGYAATLQEFAFDLPNYRELKILYEMMKKGTVKFASVDNYSMKNKVYMQLLRQQNIELS